MSTSQLLLTLLVALVVFGPNELPHVARQMGRGFRRLKEYQQTAMKAWQQQLDAEQLQENNNKAQIADVEYEKKRASNP
jgi:sec-independent protein translocase protein TatB